MSHENTNIEETEETQENKINDIIKVDEIIDVNISDIFLLSKASVFKKLFKKNTQDLKKEIKNKINLSINPKIKLLKLFNPINDIKKTKKNKDIILNFYSPDIDNNTLNFINIEEKKLSKGPYSDIIKPKINYSKVIKKQIFNYFEKIKNLNYRKFSMGFFLFFFLFFSYIGITKYQITKTFNQIKTFNLNQNLKNLNSNLISLKTNLIISNILLKPIYTLNFFINNNSLNNLNYAFYGTQNLVDFGLNGLTIYDGVNNLISKKGFEDVMYSQLIANIDPIILKMNGNINNSINYFEKIKNLGDDNLNAVFFKKLNEIKNIKNFFNVFYNNKEIIKSMLGDESKKTYLIVFQNNDEIRPTGGFMGSVGFLEIFKGKILNFEKKDIYALEWDIKKYLTEAPPEGINKISTIFGLRDANYFIDLKKSSDKIKYFIDKTNYKIDGIVYINQNIILNFLEKFSGIYFDKVKREINSNNFSMIMSTLVEAKISKTFTLATPKQILFDFIEQYLKHLKEKGDYLGYIKLFFDSIENKDILVYSFNQNENNFLKELGLNSKEKFDNYVDFNYPVFTSIGGNKSDRYITRTFEKNIKINNDCSINSSLNIILKDNFNLTEEINIKNLLYDMNLLGKIDINSTLDIEGKGDNKQYIRVLIPKDAIVEENKKIKVKTGNNFKEVSFYLTTNTLFESNFKIKYFIPNKSCQNYNYTFIKQPGINKYNLVVNKNGNLVQSIYTDKDYSY